MYDLNPAIGLKVALMELVPWLQSPQSYMDTLTTSDKLRNYQIFFERLWSGLDARDVYYQLDGWSEFNVGDTPGFNGDTKTAVAAIKAKTLLIGVKEDQLFRREELQSAKNAIRDATHLELSSPAGHAAVVGGLDPKFDETLIREIAKFLTTIK
jgi:homoserine O-acetyltransferase/O-succinyltransferase